LIRWLTIGTLVGSMSFAWIEVEPWTLALAVLLLCGSAFFSGSETALFSLQPLDRSRIRERGALGVDELLDQPRQTLATILIGNELTNVALSTVTAYLIIQAGLPPWMNILFLTPLLLVMGEIVPKVMALRHGATIAPIVARPLAFISVLVTPVRVVLSWLANGIVSLTGGDQARAGLELREEQLKILIRQGHLRGDIDPLEQEMLHGVLAFGDLSLSRLLTPRADVFSLSLSTPWDEVLDAIESAGHSRIPIWQGSPDSIVGILVVKDLLPVIAEIRRGNRKLPHARDLQRLLHPPRFVPVSKRAEDMLREFRTERFHMALAVEEHGLMVGLVTLDDLLGELVGELLDERDDETQDLVEIQSGLYTLRAAMDVEDFERQFNHALPEGEYTTVGGFLLHQLGEVPLKGAELDWEGFRFVVTGLDAQRVTEICVYPPSHMPLQESG
jgi:putative hemolysin